MFGPNHVPTSLPAEQPAFAVFKEDVSYDSGELTFT